MTASATPLFVCDQPGVYRMATPDEVRGTALNLLAGDLIETPLVNSPTVVKAFFQLQIGDLQHEVFSVIFLNCQNRFLAYEQMFRGSLTSTVVYPRELVKRALELGADGVILSHNHPSGNPNPSQADLILTSTLKAALALVDVKVRDHIIVTRGLVTSMAETGQL